MFGNKYSYSAYGSAEISLQEDGEHSSREIWREDKSSLELIEMLKTINHRVDQNLNSISGMSFIVETFMDFPFPAWVKDRTSRMVAVNRAYCDKYNKPFDEYVGGTDYKLWETDEADRFNSNDQKVLDTETPQTFIEPVQLDDGTLEQLLVIKFPVYKELELVGVGGFCVYLPLTKHA